MSERGVFAVDRGIWDHALFAAEPFSEREAWIWLVSEAAYKPRSRRADGKVIVTERGQLCHAVRFMAEAWQWSKSRVDRFLDRLENQDMIRRERGTRTPVITICNYDDYQRVALPSRDDSGTTTGTSAGQQRDKLEGKENKENTSETSSLRSADAPDGDGKAKPERQAILDELTAVVSAERANAIVAHRKRIKAPLGTHAAKLLAKSLSKVPDPNSAADLMIERGWRGFDPNWGPAQSLVSAPPPPPATPADQDDQWRRRLKRWRETGEWNGHWGNHPETPGFQALCPRHILREFNLERQSA